MIKLRTDQENKNHKAMNKYEILSSTNNAFFTDNKDSNPALGLDEIGDDTDGSTIAHASSSFPMGIVDRLLRKLSWCMESSTQEEYPTSNSRVITVCLLLSTMLGSGILNQPAVFREAGVFGGVILFIVAGYFVWLGGVITIECGLITKMTTFQQLVEHVLGVNGKVALDLFIVLGYIGAITSYLTVIGGTASSLLLLGGVSSAIGNVYSITLLLTSLCVLPLCLHRYYGHLGKVSYLSAGFVVVIVLFVVIAGPIYSIQDRTDDHATQITRHPGDVMMVDNNGSVVLISVVGMFRKIGSVVFSITCLPAVFHAYNSMEDKTVSWKDVMVRCF